MCVFLLLSMRTSDSVVTNESFALVLFGIFLLTSVYLLEKKKKKKYKNMSIPFEKNMIANTFDHIVS